MAYSSPRTWVTAEVVTAAHMNQEVRDNLLAQFPDGAASVSWTPKLEASSGTPATSLAEGRRWRVGPLMFVWARFVISLNGTGRFQVDLPVASAHLTGSASQGAGQSIGQWVGRDNSVAGSIGGSVVLADADTVQFVSPSIGVGLVSNTEPFTWAVDDVLSFSAVYTVA